MSIIGKEAVWPCAILQNKPALAMSEFPSRLRFKKVYHIANHSPLLDETRLLSVLRQPWSRVIPI